jgi:hypothetical protein
MHADLDTLCIAVFCTADDLLPEKAGNARRRVTDAEVVTLCVVQAVVLVASVLALSVLAGCTLPKPSGEGTIRYRDQVLPAGGRHSGRAPGPDLGPRRRLHGRRQVQRRDSGQLLRPSAGAVTSLLVDWRPEDPGKSGNPGFSSAIRAAVSVSGGTPTNEAIDEDDPPAIFFHGSEDRTVPFPFPSSGRSATPPRCMARASSRCSGDRRRRPRPRLDHPDPGAVRLLPLLRAGPGRRPELSGLSRRAARRAVAGAGPAPVAAGRRAASPPGRTRPSAACRGGGGSLAERPGSAGR